MAEGSSSSCEIRNANQPDSRVPDDMQSMSGWGNRGRLPGIFLILNPLASLEQRFCSMRQKAASYLARHIANGYSEVPNGYIFAW
ncbi:unnamed protein product [Anisakis simplex]|uniref:Uncharacterized protein n=1 Tax=Anisakis simplex TaxID=6269 RepID=A0A3P6P083_ANISI|nr:unnamed protein product [Anisakis simplex]